MPETEWSLFENGMPGLHLTLNPQKPLPPEARINRQFIDHSLTLSDQELKSLLGGRAAGIATLDTLMGHLLPGFTAARRLTFATQIADKILDKSLAAQLSLEAPTMLNRLEQRDDALKQVFQQPLPPGARRAPAPTLLEHVPFGVSLTVWF